MCGVNLVQFLRKNILSHNNVSTLTATKDAVRDGVLEIESNLVMLPQRLGWIETIG
jgi:hypothetical protein